MKTSGAFLFFLFCLCEAGTDIHFKLTIDHHENYGTENTVCGVPAIKPWLVGCPRRTEEVNGLVLIVNGTTAKPHSWPWQVSLQRNGQHFCGGSLIFQNWVVTAAHCQVGTSDLVVLGLQSIKNHGQVRKINKVFNNPKWPHGYDYDIALIHLESPASMNNDVSPVCLAFDPNKFPAGMNCFATGWGSLGNNTDPIDLQQACLPILTNTKCQTFFNKQMLINITPRMICAGASGSGDCYGDSGGPLVCEKNGLWYLVGVTNFGFPACPTNVTTVFARITELRPWIDKIIHVNGTLGCRDGSPGLQGCREII